MGQQDKQGRLAPALAMMIGLGCSLASSASGQLTPIVTLKKTYGTTAVQVAAGLDHTCVINGCGEVQCWGRNDFGQASPPARVRFDQISGGLWHTCGIRSKDGLTECWGRSGLLTTPPATHFVKIDAGDLHTCGLRADGGLECWGIDWNGSVYAAPGPQGVPTTDIAAGTHLTCATYDGLPGVQCVGGGPYGSPAPFTPPELRLGYGSPDVITTGNGFSCVLMGTYTQCFGDNTQGQASGLGADASIATLEVATAAANGGWTFGSYRFLDISAGIDSTCAIRDTHPDRGTLHCWGRGHHGSGKTPLPGGDDFVQVSTGRDHACAIDAAGTVSCWSWNAEDYYGRTEVPFIGCRFEAFVNESVQIQDLQRIK